MAPEALRNCLLHRLDGVTTYNIPPAILQVCVCVCVCVCARAGVCVCVCGYARAPATLQVSVIQSQARPAPLGATSYLPRTLSMFALARSA